MKSKQGFTLIELLAVIVVLAIIVLLAVTAAVPMMNRAKKSSLADEALAYIRAAKQAYTVENMDGSMSTCYDVSYLNEKYIMKEDNNYQGMVIVSGPINDINFSISLSNGKFYVVKNNASKVTISDVSNSKPSGYAASCGSYNAVLSNNVNTNSLVYKLIMANGKSTLEANLNDISTRSASVSFTSPVTTAAESGMFTAEDDDGASYYYRGVINNNWVCFAGFYWRIIRINGDGSIRMIYSGTASSNHTGNNAHISSVPFGDNAVNSTTTPDITGLTNTNITTTYYNGAFTNAHVGYMYNPTKIISTYPDYTVSASKTLSNFPYHYGIDNSKQYYLFKNFNPSTDCFAGNGTDETGTCTLKCAKLGDDCVLTNWNTWATTEGNYSTTAAGSTSTLYVYTSPYKYSCFQNGTAVTKTNSNNTTSVYVSCPLVNEIVGTVKDQATQIKTKRHGLFSPSLEVSKENIRNSKIKTEIDNWYQTNIYNKKDSSNKYYEEYLTDEIFCNDRSTPVVQAFPHPDSSAYYYAPSYRSNSYKIPTYKCVDKNNDGFTLTNSGTSSIVTPKNNGNNMLKYPVGLITGDEIMYAGAVRDTSTETTNINTQFYLYTGANYWTMSPYTFSGYWGTVYFEFLTTDGRLNTQKSCCGSMGVRPVINLSPDVLFNSGNGTESSPYTVKLQ